MSRPRREIMLTIAKIPDILQKQPFKVHIERRIPPIPCRAFAV
jgi:hypothetical protein